MCQIVTVTWQSLIGFSADETNQFKPNQKSEGRFIERQRPVSHTWRSVKSHVQAKAGGSYWFQVQGDDVCVR